MLETLKSILQGVFLLMAAPALVGWINWLKAGGQGRKREWTYIFQPYWNLVTLLRVPAVRPKTASWLFSLTPWVLFTSYAWLAFTIPVFSEPLLAMDVIVVIYVLALARFTISLAGWDAGAPFGGLGGSREMFLHFLTEVGLFLFFAALALHWATLNLSAIIAEHAQIILGLDPDFKNLGLIFLALALALLILFEAGRLPIANPDTHLELTMAQKAVLIEFAGSDLALVEWAESVKTMFLFALFSNLFLPNPFLPFPIPLQANLWENPWLALLCFAAEITLLGGLLALWELCQAKTRLRQVSRLAWISMLFSLISIVLTIATRSVLP
jgi:formate hydrogenlyase subunit 4